MMRVSGFCREVMASLWSVKRQSSLVILIFMLVTLSGLFAVQLYMTLSSRLAEQLQGLQPNQAWLQLEMRPLATTKPVLPFDAIDDMALIVEEALFSSTVYQTDLPKSWQLTAVKYQGPQLTPGMSSHWLHPLAEHAKPGALVTQAAFDEGRRQGLILSQPPVSAADTPSTPIPPLGWLKIGHYQLPVWSIVSEGSEIHPLLSPMDKKHILVPMDWAQTVYKLKLIDCLVSMQPGAPLNDWLEASEARWSGLSNLYEMPIVGFMAKLKETALVSQRVGYWQMAALLLLMALMTLMLGRWQSQVKVEEWGQRLLAGASRRQVVAQLFAEWSMLWVVAQGLAMLLWAVTQPILIHQEWLAPIQCPAFWLTLSAGCSSLLMVGAAAIPARKLFGVAPHVLIHHSTQLY